MRIRTIKPEFWTSLTVTALPAEVRLTFIGLWNFVDDEGRALADTRLIKAAIWPLDDAVTAEVVAIHLDQLRDVRLITSYAVEGRRYLSVNGWDEHQSISKPRPGRLPDPSGPDPGTFLAGKEGKGREQGKEGNGIEAATPIVDKNPNQPTHDQMYLAERLDLGIPVVVKLNKRFGRGLVADSMRLLHGFPPEEGVENVVAYLTTLCELKAAG